MFSWCRAQIEEHGIRVAAPLIGRVARSRARVQLANRFFPATVECPCCGWTGRQFFDYIEVGYTVPNASCPQCDSHSRHRAFYLWLRNTYQLKTRQGTALMFAPERALESLWEEADKLRLIRIDIAPARGVDLLANAESLPIADESMDLIWCHHVLEHVERDHEAIHELSRVLRRGGGELIVSVPMELGTLTREYGFANPHESGHWRMYGDDFADLLASKGLTVETLTHELSPEDCRRYGIVPERFYICRKNGRAVGGK
ncbi:MAG: methyltransferase domain-containing protein [Pyrinomonadaceae bacterium]|nr:methyltransferase domain-containing protein [Pyrinomonadaceae bacterium]